MEGQVLRRELYTVTDKADGRGMLLYVAGATVESAPEPTRGADTSSNGTPRRPLVAAGQVYLIDSNSHVYNTGLTVTNPQYYNTLFEWGVFARECGV